MIEEQPSSTGIEPGWPLTPEEEANAELDALLGAFDDVQGEPKYNHEERRVRDELIFTGLKRVLTTVEGMKNVMLMQEMRTRIGEMACNHAHFAEAADSFDLLGKNSEANDHVHSDHQHKNETDEDDDSDDPKASLKHKKEKKAQKKTAWSKFLGSLTLKRPSKQPHNSKHDFTLAA